MAERQANTLESVIRGRHIYKQIWRPLVWDILTLEREEAKNHDKFAVSLLKHLFLTSFRGCFGTSSGTETITCEVTDRRKRGKGTSQH